MNNKHLLVVVVILLLLICLPQLSEAQCAMCQANVKTAMMNKDGKKVGTGLNNGILFLLASPYVLVGTAFLIWRKKSKKQNISVNE